MPTNPVPRNSPDNWGALRVLWIFYGFLRIAVAILLIVYSGTATLMFGALLTRVPDPYTLMNAFHFFYTCAIVLIFLSGVLSLLAGFALLGGRPAARPLALVAAFLSVGDPPLGTTLGIYTLIVFLR
jgi:hypothetical protein